MIKTSLTPPDVLSPRISGIDSPRNITILECLVHSKQPNIDASWEAPISAFELDSCRYNPMSHGAKFEIDRWLPSCIKRGEIRRLMAWTVSSSTLPRRLRVPLSPPFHSPPVKRSGLALQPWRSNCQRMCCLRQLRYYLTAYLAEFTDHCKLEDMNKYPIR